MEELTEDEVRSCLRGLYRIASVASHDRSTQNAAMTIAAGEAVAFVKARGLGPGLQYRDVGANQFGRGIDPTDPANHEKPRKYGRIVHAERAAIFSAAKRGMRLDGAVMVALWAPCGGCAQAIVESGIRRLYAHGERMDATPERWKAEVEFGLEICRLGGVEVIRVEGPVDAGVTILFDGKEIQV